MYSQGHLTKFFFVGVVLGVMMVAGCEESAPVEPIGTAPLGRVPIASLYDAEPRLSDCFAGQLKQIERDRALAYINAIRQRAGLSPVSYRSSDDASTAAAAMIVAANDLLAHQPATSVKCWSQLGYDGSDHSNLGWAWAAGLGASVDSTTALIDTWMKDSGTANLGHRRWILDPFLKYLSFGRADIAHADGSTTTGSALRVIYDEKQTVGDVEFVAFPMDATPLRQFNNGIAMSFSVVANKDEFFKNDQVDFAAATIDIRNPEGIAVPISKRSDDHTFAGLGNVLMWYAPVVEQVEYAVTIQGVKVAGVTKSFQYTFRLTQ